MTLLRIFIICIILVNSGCAGGELRLKQAQFDYEKAEHSRERMEKKYLSGRIRIERFKAMRLKNKKFLRQEDNLILKSFEGSGIILKAFNKIGLSIFDIAGFLNEYGNDNINGFCDYLETRYPFSTKQRWWLDDNIFVPAKRNYELIKRLEQRY